jgi:hypothetical protein
MLVRMRTTLNLPDALVEQAKAVARQSGRTLTSLVEQGLRTVLDAAESQPPELPVFGTGHGRVLVDLDDRQALADALDREA